MDIFIETSLEASSISNSVKYRKYIQSNSKYVNSIRYYLSNINSNMNNILRIVHVIPQIQYVF